MKKLFGLFLLSIAVLFFSCATTGTVSEGVLEPIVSAEPQETVETKDVEETPSVETSESNEEDNSLPETSEEENAEDEAAVEDDESDSYVEETERAEGERIPQEEIDELNSLLTYEETPVEESKPEEVSQTEEAKDETVEETKTVEETAQPEPLPVPEPSATQNVASTTENNENANIASEYDFSDEQSNADETLLGKEAPVIIPSRTLTVKRNQYVDIIYPGTGWIYLGEENKTNHFVFQGRKLQKGESVFTLRSKTSGTTILHFYKNDALTGNYIDDYIEITVTDESAFDTKHIVAPSYADAVPPKYQPEPEEETKEEVPPPKPVEQKKELPKPQPQTPPSKETTNIQQKDFVPETKENTENVQTVIQTSEPIENEGGKDTSVAGTPAMPEGEEVQTPSTESTIDPSTITDSEKTLLEKAQKAYDEKRYADALKYIEQFFVVATEEFDAGLYLEGRILEAKSEVQNIKRAIEAYDTLLKNWPQSKFWRRANERSIYLKRFYIDIR